MAVTDITYKALVTTIETIALSHLGVDQFYMGELSNIEMRSNDNPNENYTLVFLNPVSATYAGGYMTFNMNLLAMDLAKKSKEREVNVHNSTLSILQDIIAKFKLTYDQQIRIPDGWTVSWFTEGQKQSVAGWSVNLNFTVINPLDLCKAAFETVEEL